MRVPSSHFPKGQSRHGVLLLEACVSLVVLAGAAVLVAQFATWTLTERAQVDARLATSEAAANVLERAGALPWNELTPEWASAQRLPEHLAARWPNCRLTVRVEPEVKWPLVKRVAVEIRWTDAAPAKGKPFTLTAVFAARHAEGKK